MDVSSKGLEKTKNLIEDDGLGTNHIELYQGDITNEDSVRDMVESCVRVFGRLDVAVNNAGIGGSSTRTADLSIEEYDRVCNVNEKGVGCPMRNSRRYHSRSFRPFCAKHTRSNRC